MAFTSKNSFKSPLVDELSEKLAHKFGEVRARFPVVDSRLSELQASAEELLHQLQDFTVARKSVPPCDLVETLANFSATIDLPGVHAADITVELVKRTLFITARRNRSAAQEINSSLAENPAAKRSERYAGVFRRSFRLPLDIEPQKIRATFQNGVLTIDVPKLEITGSRTIPVSEKKNGDLPFSTRVAPTSWSGMEMKTVSDSHH